MKETSHLEREKALSQRDWGCRISEALKLPGLWKAASAAREMRVSRLAQEVYRTKSLGPGDSKEFELPREMERSWRALCTGRGRL